MRFWTAGESHGKGLTVLMECLPAGLSVRSAEVNADLARRQLGYGRGGRQMMEKDQVQFLAGLRFGKTTGAPLVMFIENKDAVNWLEIMAPEGEPTADRKFVRPRPGHADLAAYYKYGLEDLRDSLERSSARETAARVAAGGIAKAFLKQFGIEIFSHVTLLGGIRVPVAEMPQDWQALRERVEGNDLRCAGSDKTLQAIRDHIDAVRKAGSTLGGEVECVALNVPPGLGSYVQWDRKLDGQLAQAVMSIQAVKAVSIGEGVLGGEVIGTDFHDEIRLTEAGRLTRPTNRAGGLEGGVTNGEPLIVRATMKPISTLIQPLMSINLESMTEESAHFERSDVTAVPACGVVVEAMMALTLARAFMEKFGQDQVEDIRKAYEAYCQRLKPIPDPLEIP
jgi:chorismate synthase